MKTTAVYLKVIQTEQQLNTSKSITGINCDNHLLGLKGLSHLHQQCQFVCGNEDEICLIPLWGLPGFTTRRAGLWSSHSKQVRRAVVSLSSTRTSKLWTQRRLSWRDALMSGAKCVSQTSPKSPPERHFVSRSATHLRKSRYFTGLINQHKTQYYPLPESRGTNWYIFILLRSLCLISSIGYCTISSPNVMLHRAEISYRLENANFLSMD